MAHCSAVVATFRQRHTAEIAQGFLDDAGLRSAVAVDDAGGLIAGITLGPEQAQLLVRPDDVREARRVLVEAGMVESDGEDPGDGEPAEP